MTFAGRWVSLELMNSLFILWFIGVVVFGLLVFYFFRKSPPKGGSKASSANRRSRPARGAKD